MRLAACTQTLWQARRWTREGRERLSQVLHMDGAETTRARGAALNAAGYLAYADADLPAARVYAEESRAISQTLGDQEGIAVSATLQAHVTRDSMEAIALYELAVNVHRQFGNRGDEAMNLVSISARQLTLGDYSTAEATANVALALYRELGVQEGVVRCLLALGTIAGLRRDTSQAKSLLEESLSVARSVVLPHLVGRALHMFGVLALDHGDTRVARARFLELLDLGVRMANQHDSGQVADHHLVALAVEDVGGLFMAAEPNRAAVLFGAAQAMRGRMGIRMLGEHSQRMAAWKDRTSRSLGEEAFLGFLAKGETLLAHEAVAQARSPKGGSRGIAARGIAARPGGLTAREIEVVQCLADEQSNRAIAEQLIISPTTAERHVANILEKLGLRSRAEVRLWALQQGLTLGAEES
jgi:DNA-binding CsgD family transcriptional regulator